MSRCYKNPSLWPVLEAFHTTEAPEHVLSIVKPLGSIQQLPLYLFTMPRKVHRSSGSTAKEGNSLL